MAGRIVRDVVLHFVSISLVGAMLTGCATIPSEAAELSSELGNRISALQNANLTLLNRYFDLKRAEVDRFIEETWVPEYAMEVFKHPTIAKGWDTIVQENDPSERLKFIVWLGPKIQSKINSKRLEIISPIDSIEQQIEDQLRSAYAEVRAINNTLTAFLLSASRVAENRNRYLDMVGVTDEQIGDVIYEIDNVVADLLAVGKDAENTITQIEDAEQQYVEKLKNVGALLGVKE